MPLDGAVQVGFRRGHAVVAQARRAIDGRQPLHKLTAKLRLRRAERKVQWLHSRFRTTVGPPCSHPVGCASGGGPMYRQRPGEAVVTVCV